MTLRYLPEATQIILGFEIFEIGPDMLEIIYKTTFWDRLKMGCRYKPKLAFFGQNGIRKIIEIHREGFLRQYKVGGIEIFEFLLDLGEFYSLLMLSSILCLEGGDSNPSGFEIF